MLKDWNLRYAAIPRHECADGPGSQREKNAFRFSREVMS
jgi:hypothetical protein